MKVLISGANGHIGRALARFIKNSETISLRTNSEIGDYEKLNNCNVFIHCGGLINGNFSQLFASNTVLLQKILDYLSIFNPNAHIIFLSTGSLLANKVQVSSDDYLETNKMTDYALSKYIAELILERYNLSFTSLRFSTIFYKDPERDGLSKFIFDAMKYKEITLFNSGNAMRDFIPLEIVVKYIFKIMGNSKFFKRKLNIVSGSPLSFREIGEFLMTKIDGLEVKNRKVEPIKQVPYDFSIDDILEIGRIDFDIFKFIEDYLFGRDSWMPSDY
jgi:nucleoside-diphosphate-sugar epimerase